MTSIFELIKLKVHFSKILISSKWSIFEGTNFPNWSISKLAIFEKGFKIWIYPFFEVTPIFEMIEFEVTLIYEVKFEVTFRRNRYFQETRFFEITHFWSDPFFEMSFRWNRYCRVLKSEDAGIRTRHLSTKHATRVYLPSALHPCWPERAHALYIGTGPSGSPRLTTHCSEWPLFPKRSWLIFM